MTRTNAVHLILLAALGGGLAWFLEAALAASGNAILIPPFTIALVLAVIGVIVVVLALPVRRVSRGLPGARVDPFYATRVVTLAKSSSLGGALLGGGGLAITLYLLSRSVLPGVGSVSMALALAIGGIVLLILGLIAEHMCALPPDDDDPSKSQREAIK